tara:strand:+ start:743 stop:1138 length:396 start_codon:yes stop_codon:yes gene_type:complete
MNIIEVQNAQEAAQIVEMVADEDWSVNDVIGEADQRDRGEMMLTIPGTTDCVHWFEEAWEISWYTLPFAERRSREDHTVMLETMLDFDWMIDAVGELLETGVHDISVTEFQGGSPVCEIDLDNYFEKQEKS